MELITQILTNFNRGAKTYDLAAHIQTAVAEKMAADLSQLSAAAVLEIGCGTGVLSQHLPILFPKAQCRITDISTEMLAQCRQRLSPTERIKIEWLDGENFQFTQSFDLIVSSMTLHWFTQLKASLQNIQAHLKKGGYFIFSLLGSQSFKEWRMACQQLKFTCRIVGLS